MQESSNNNQQFVHHMARRRTIQSSGTGSSNRHKTWGPRMTTLFYAMLILAFVQLSCLLYVGFWHTTMDSTSPLEEFLLSSFMGWGLLDDDEEIVKLLSESEALENSEPADDDDDAFDGQSIASPLDQGPPLDNYYSRSHTNRHTAVPLIVGGSDGSGTRAFVDVLSRLGVPMLVDDTGTMDVHAGKLFAGKGWPPFAKIALQYSKNTTNYQVSDLPEEQQNEVKTELAKLREQFRIRYTKLRSHLSARGKHVVLSSAVSYGFKAPITMLLLPMLQAYMYPSGFKYLHIVRDGRDVSLSSNQSPVAKFYNSTYPDAALRLAKYEHMAPIFAMHLWNDWNADLYNWERTEQQAQPRNFDFLVMRSEDLLRPESKFEALTMLADFVGSAKTPQELCCMQRKSIVDMGQSINLGKKPAMDGAHSKLLEYLDRRKELQQKMAELSGKSEFTKMTGAELIEAKAKYRQQLKDSVLTNVDGKEQEKDEERKQRILEVGNRVAQRIANRHKAANVAAGAEGSSSSQIKHYQTMNPEIANFLRKMGRRQTVDPAIADLIGRRRRLSAEEYGARGGNPATGGGAAAAATEHDAVLPQRVAGRAYKMVMMPRKIRKKQDMGDERLAKLLASQLDVLKGNALKLQKNATVTDRYGKWATMLSSAPELSEAMHREGARALELFGYHPPRRFMDRRASSKDQFVCDDTVVCPDAK